MEKQEFGRTGHKSSRLLFGACAFYFTKDSDLVNRTLDMTFAAGINHIDTAEGYGESQIMMGPWIKKHRDEIFLATKTESRDYRGAMKALEESLELMQTDRIDLWQMHCLAEPEEWEKAKDPENGAIRAFEEARSKGLAKYLGVTSHGMKAPFVLMDALKHYPFDSVLLPYNFTMIRDPEYKKAFFELSEKCKETRTAMQIIKTACRRPLEEGDKRFVTWYEPFTEQEDLDTALGWALDLDHAFINSAAEIPLLPKIIKAVNNRKKVSDKEMEEFALAKEMGNPFL